MTALYTWLRRHPTLVDAALAAALAIVGILPAITMGHYLPVPLDLGLTIPVVFRRSHPTAAFAVATVAGAATVFIAIRPVATALAIVVLLYTLAAYRPHRVSLAGLAVCLAGSAVAIFVWLPQRLNAMDSLLAGTMMFAAPALTAWVLGDSMRYRRAYYLNLEERAARLERERDARAQIAAATERARIARELHDVVAHHVSVMVVQADGASYALDSDPARAQQALGAISATGRAALAEMRRLLGVLRAERDAADRAPLPGIGQLNDLMDQARAAGLPVSFTVEGVPRPLPSGAELAAYRIVQESLTNTRKHAGPDANARVALRYTEDELVLVISDDGRGAAAKGDGSGHGLSGMRERVAIYGGRVAAGPSPCGGFEVAARLPLAAGAPGASAAGRTGARAPSPDLAVPTSLPTSPPAAPARRGAAA